MGNTIAGVDVGQELYDTFGAEAQDLTLVRRTPGTRGVNVSAGTNPTTVEYLCKGYQIFDTKKLPEKLVRASTHVFGIYGGSPALRDADVGPRSDDQIIANGVTYKIGPVLAGAVRGVWVCFTSGVA